MAKKNSLEREIEASLKTTDNETYEAAIQRVQMLIELLSLTEAERGY